MTNEEWDPQELVDLARNPKALQETQEQYDQLREQVTDAVRCSAILVVEQILSDGGVKMSEEFRQDVVSLLDVSLGKIGTFFNLGVLEIRIAAVESMLDTLDPDGDKGFKEKWRDLVAVVTGENQTVQ